MTFTTTPPTKPGFYAWRHIGSEHVQLWNITRVNIPFKFTDGREMGGEWCRLIPAEEVKKAYGEGWAIEDFVDVEDAWISSHAKRVMEGEI